MNDDTLSDRLDYLADRHADFFEWLDVLWTYPEMPGDWDLQEPSAEELAQMEEEAESLLAWLENNDE